MTTPRNLSSAVPRTFQFRLATLLIATTWAALISLGLRSPTALWSGVIAVLTLLAVLMAVLLLIYRTGRTRAMAIGFLVFCVGYLAYLAILAGTLSSGLSDPTTPVGSAFDYFFDSVHHYPNLNSGAMGGMGEGGMGGGFEGAVLRTNPIRRPPAFERRDFLAICNNALACLLGLAGAITAQILLATQSRPPK